MADPLSLSGGGPGTLHPVDEAAGEDDPGHGEGSVSQRDHPIQVSTTVSVAWSHGHHLRSEVQVKAGKSEQTQGHMKKKITDMQRQIKQTARDTAKLVCKLHSFPLSFLCVCAGMTRSQGRHQKAWLQWRESWRDKRKYARLCSPTWRSWSRRLTSARRARPRCASDHVHK